MKNNLILVGYMGCGKSSVGRQLARQLRVPFLDTDQWIEDREKRSITEIFAVQGEAIFRDLETAALKELLQETKSQKRENAGKVISVGGGMVLRDQNRSLLRQLGTVVYLKASEETIYQRLKGDKKRPLLQTENPKKRIQEMMEEREEKYQEAAHRVVLVDHKTIPEIVKEIQAL